MTESVIRYITKSDVNGWESGGICPRVITTLVVCVLASLCVRLLVMGVPGSPVSRLVVEKFPK